MGKFDWLWGDCVTCVGLYTYIPFVAVLAGMVYAAAHFRDSCVECRNIRRFLTYTWVHGLYAGVAANQRTLGLKPLFLIV